MFRNAILLILTVCLLSACNQPAPPAAEPTKIGVIDTARVFRESEPAKAGVKFLESIQTEMQGQLTQLQEKMQNDPENVALQQEIQTMYGEFQQRIGAEEQNVVNLLQDSMQRSIDALRMSKNIDIIVGAEVALSYSQALSLTDEIIAEMNKVKIEFKAIAPEAPAEEMTPSPMQAPAAEEATTQTPAPEQSQEQAPATEAPTTETKSPEAKPAQ